MLGLLFPRSRRSALVWKCVYNRVAFGVLAFDSHSVIYTMYRMLINTFWKGDNTLNSQINASRNHPILHSDLLNRYPIVLGQGLFGFRVLHSLVRFNWLLCAKHWATVLRRSSIDFVACATLRWLDFLSIAPIAWGTYNVFFVQLDQFVWIHYLCEALCTWFQFLLIQWPADCTWLLCFRIDES